MRRLGPSPRPAFTLIELLVVIAIIAALAALLLVAIVPMINKGPELQTTSDLRNLTIAINNFKQKNNVFPPSRITLSDNPKNMDAASLSYVTTIWQRIDFSGASGLIDWAGNGRRGTFHLEGDQCLVFFLGGIPDSITPDRKGCRGFSSNPLNPTDFNSGTRESFYQFESARLVSLHPTPDYARGSPFYSFADPWSTGVPYAYFSSGKRKDGYNPAPPRSRALPQLQPGIPAGGDCASLLPGGPYNNWGSPVTYSNATSFQIISAGKDGLFGPGGVWPLPATYVTKYDKPTEDNQTNFYDSTLGVPQ